MTVHAASFWRSPVSPGSQDPEPMGRNIERVRNGRQPRDGLAGEGPGRIYTAPMLDHVVLNATDYDRSRQFYEQALAPHRGGLPCA
jgi:hypothetical protein